MNTEVCEYKRLKYVLSFPKGYAEDGKYPLLIFLHGAGTRGTDIECLLNNPFFTETGDNLSEFIVAAPQCYADTWFDLMEQLHEFCADIVKRRDVDVARCYLMGASMGGYAVWQEAMSQSDLYAAVVPICGGGMYWNAARLKNVRVRAFHGSEDRVVFPEESRKMVDAVKNCGGDAELVVFEGAEHNSWSMVYRDKEVFEWLLAQKKNLRANGVSLLNNSEMFG